MNICALIVPSRWAQKLTKMLPRPNWLLNPELLKRYLPIPKALRKNSIPFQVICKLKKGPARILRINQKGPTELKPLPRDEIPQTDSPGTLGWWNDRWGKSYWPKSLHSLWVSIIPSFPAYRQALNLIGYRVGRQDSNIPIFVSPTPKREERYWFPSPSF